MNVDPDVMSRRILAAFEQAHLHGPFVGHARGVWIMVGIDGVPVDLAFDRDIYRTCESDDLGAAIVSAHREAREAALAGQHQAILEVLDTCRIDDSTPERQR